MKSHSLIPSFWKNNKRTNLSRPRHGDGEAKYIEIIGNKKIIAGTVMVPNNFLGYITKPAYWTNGSRSTCQIGSIDAGWQNSEVFDLFVDSQENIFLAGLDGYNKTSPKKLEMDEVLQNYKLEKKSCRGER